jgi:hypothetical protein
MVPLAVTVTQLVHKDSEEQEEIPIREHDGAEGECETGSLADGSTAGRMDSKDRIMWNAM